MYSLGFLGLGKMGSSIACGVLSKGLYPKEGISFFAPSEKTQQNGLSMGMALAKSERELAESSKVIVLAIKPQKYDEVFAKLQGLDFKGKAIISLAPGKSIEQLSSVFEGASISRVMPNTPSLIGHGVTTIAFGGDTIKEVIDIFSSIGTYLVVKEKQIDEAIPLNGSMPAYLFEFVKAFVECGVSYGIGKEDAKKLALNAIIGSCMLALESKEDLDTLIDNVCSKGGSTIAGLNKLKENGFDEAIRQCYEACVKRSIELGEKK